MAATRTTRLSPDIDGTPVKGPFSVEITRAVFYVSKIDPPGRYLTIADPSRLALHLHWLVMTAIYDPELEYITPSERGQAALTDELSMLKDYGAVLLINSADEEAQLADSAGVANEWAQLKHIMAENLASNPECMPTYKDWAPLHTTVEISRVGFRVRYMNSNLAPIMDVFFEDHLKDARPGDPIVVVCSQDPRRRSDVAEADDVGLQQEYDASVDDTDSAERDIDINSSDTESLGSSDSQAGNNSQPGRSDEAPVQLNQYGEVTNPANQRQGARRRANSEFRQNDPQWY